ncbi:hypothetical protein K474DRAFT_1671211 [Panus rudis PR-1116 ss-1]|nr:hypothetical protein K474DRAFT_1671211 [Panus rudis PR-1116 ss-1]
MTHMRGNENHMFGAIQSMWGRKRRSEGNLIEEDGMGSGFFEIHKAGTRLCFALLHLTTKNVERFAGGAQQAAMCDRLQSRCCAWSRITSRRHASKAAAVLRLSHPLMTLVKDETQIVLESRRNFLKQYTCVLPAVVTLTSPDSDGLPPPPQGLRSIWILRLVLSVLGNACGCTSLALLQQTASYLELEFLGELDIEGHCTL